MSYVCAAFNFMLQPPTLKLYSVYYKPFPLQPNADYVVPIQAGAALHQRLPYVGDDTGDNISLRNNLYSELSAAYWIFKNAKRDTDAWGLCHYRRYLIPLYRKYFFKPKSRRYFPTSQKVLDGLLTPQLHQHYAVLLQTHDVLVQKPVAVWRTGRKLLTIKEAYYHNHIAHHWNVMMQVVVEKYPDYARSIATFGNRKHMWFNNVMVARWELWDQYLAWLFSILFEVERRIELPGKGYQERVFGFMAERLHNLFIYHNKLKAAYLTLALFED